MPLAPSALYDLITQHPLQALLGFLTCRGPRNFLNMLRPVITASYDFAHFCRKTHRDFIAGWEGRQHDDACGMH